MNGVWDLSILYTGFDDENFSSDMQSLRESLDGIISLSERAENMRSEDVVSEYISVYERVNELASKLIIYSNLRNSANTKDAEATSNMGRLMSMLSLIAAPSAKLSKLIASYEDLDGIIADNPSLREYSYYLGNIKRDSKYLLGDGEEAVFAKMNI